MIVQEYKVVKWSEMAINIIVRKIAPIDCEGDVCLCRATTRATNTDPYPRTNKVTVGVEVGRGGNFIECL